MDEKPGAMPGRDGEVRTSGGTTWDGERPLDGFVVLP
jgi:hypothetical protein